MELELATVRVDELAERCLVARTGASEQLLGQHGRTARPLRLPSITCNDPEHRPKGPVRLPGRGVSTND